MILHLPEYLGGHTVEVMTELAVNEQIVGWVDEYGTIISSKVNKRIGYLVPVENSEIFALVMVDGT